MYEIIINIKDFELQLQLCIWEIWVADTHIITIGINGFSWGIKNKGFVMGKLLLSYFPLHLDPFLTNIKSTWLDAWLKKPTFASD